MNKKTRVFKVVTIGDSAVGKTCLINRIASDEFYETPATVGSSYMECLIELANGESVKIRLFDTAGQERYRSMTKLVYQSADAIILVFDVTNKSSFDNIRNWLIDIKDKAPVDVRIYVLGNKIDLYDDQVVYNNTIKGLDEEVINIINVSAKDKTGLKEFTNLLAEDLYKIDNDNVKDKDKDKEQKIPDKTKPPKESTEKKKKSDSPIVITNKPVTRKKNCC